MLPAHSALVVALAQNGKEASAIHEAPIAIVSWNAVILPADRPVPSVVVVFTRSERAEKLVFLQLLNIAQQMSFLDKLGNEDEYL